MTLKQTIRLSQNRKLVELLNKLVENNPELRFSQILYTYGFVKANRPTKDAGDNYQNEFYLEPEDVLKRVDTRIKDIK